MLKPGDNAGIAGRRIRLGSAVAPTIKICANPDTYRRMEGDMDIDAGCVLEGRASLGDVGGEVFAAVLSAAGSAGTKSEVLGHRELVLSHKPCEPAGSACLPGAA